MRNVRRSSLYCCLCKVGQRFQPYRRVWRPICLIWEESPKWLRLWQRNKNFVKTKRECRASLMAMNTAIECQGLVAAGFHPTLSRLYLQQCPRKRTSSTMRLQWSIWSSVRRPNCILSHISIHWGVYVFHTTASSCTSLNSLSSKLGVVYLKYWT